MGETSVKDRSISITIGRLIALVGFAISLRVMFTGTPFFVSLNWPSGTEEFIGMGMIFLGLVVVAQDKMSGWLLAIWGVGILIQAERHGNLYGAGSTYGIGVVIVNALAVASVALGLYFAIRKPPRIG